MNFNSFRKEINSKNASVKELINDIFLKIGSKDPEINSYICTTKDNAIEQAENIDKLIEKLNKEQKEVFSVWYDYLMGAISYNDAHDWRQLYNFNLDETSKYFNSFNKIEINEQAVKKYSSWLIQATQYMNMLVKFKQIRSQKNYNLFGEWQLNYDEFLKNFPNSEFNTHLQDMKIGIYNIVGDHNKFIIDHNYANKTRR